MPPSVGPRVLHFLWGSDPTKAAAFADQVHKRGLAFLTTGDELDVSLWTEQGERWASEARLLAVGGWKSAANGVTEAERVASELFALSRNPFHWRESDRASVDVFMEAARSGRAMKLHSQLGPQRIVVGVGDGKDFVVLAEPWTDFDELAIFSASQNPKYKAIAEKAKALIDSDPDLKGWGNRIKQIRVKVADGQQK